MRAVYFIFALFVAVAIAFGVLFARQASAHSWYSGKKNPVSGYSCCGGNDCHSFKAEIGKTVFPEADGLRVRLTLEEARAINPQAAFPVDALVTWDRMQQSDDFDWHICIYATNRTAPSYGVICLFEPPST